MQNINIPSSIDCPRCHSPLQFSFSCPECDVSIATCPVCGEHTSIDGMHTSFPQCPNCGGDIFVV